MKGQAVMHFRGAYLVLLMLSIFIFRITIGHSRSNLIDMLEQKQKEDEKTPWILRSPTPPPSPSAIKADPNS